MLQNKVYKTCMTDVNDLKHRTEWAKLDHAVIASMTPLSLSVRQGRRRSFINTNTNKIYIAPGILKRIGAQTHGVTRR